MKRAVVTRSDANIQEMSDLTHPGIKRYADRCEADFIIYDHEPVVWTNDKKPHYRILKAIETFKEYDRILFIDTDVVINPVCPNIFDVVPIECIGSIFEDKGRRARKRRRLIRGIQKRWGDVGWVTGYTNAGVLVASRQHARIFESQNGEYCLGWGSADVHMSYKAHQHGMKIMELPFQWNHMTIFSEKWNGSPNRFNSHIIHYAGRGRFEGKSVSRLELMRRDLETMTERYGE